MSERLIISGEKSISKEIKLEELFKLSEVDTVLKNYIEK